MHDIKVAVPGHLVQPLVGLIDAGLRASGLRAAKDAAVLADLIDGAITAAGGGAVEGEHHDREGDRN